MICQIGIYLIYQIGILLSRGDDVRLKELRIKHKMTQQRLALELNMSQNTISRYETGEREAGYAALIRIADFFHVSIDYLLEQTDNPKRQ